ncbi:CRISPR-associated protein, fragment [Oleispira antarctica RB-8]|uniref:CRISPR-associated protein n=1 Tax=Oleispira antarctica RB-8 TaxID=698738 RepID=R4YU28_OLEAN|nr:CRISPR-associated protein, fragment [Oleispira antarctica RB-8]
MHKYLLVCCRIGSLEISAVVDLKQEAKRIFMSVQRKYQHDLP